MTYNYLKPKASAPEKVVKKNNGMIKNPPAYPEMGGFKSRSVERPDHHVEKSPSARSGKPI